VNREKKVRLSPFFGELLGKRKKDSLVNRRGERGDQGKGKKQTTKLRFRSKGGGGRAPGQEAAGKRGQLRAQKKGGNVTKCQTRQLAVCQKTKGPEAE